MQTYSKNEIDSQREADNALKVQLNESVFVAMREARQETKRFFGEQEKFHKDLSEKVDLIDFKLNKSITDRVEHQAKVDEFIKEMEPFIEGKQTVIYLKKFLTWIGLPSLGAYATYFIFKHF